MQTVDFSRYGYVPSILADAVGEIAYDRLKPETKAGILPLFELCWRARARGFEDCLGFINRCEGAHPYLLDIDKRLAPPPYMAVRPSNPKAAERRYKDERAARDSFNRELKRLLRPEAGFGQWRELVSHFPHSVPVLQVTNAARQGADVLRQAQLLCEGGSSVAFRLKERGIEALCSLAAEILLALRNVDQLLLIFDCGQGRTRLGERAAFVRWAFGTIQRLVGVDRSKGLRVVCMSNSFTLPTHRGTRFKECLDWELFRRASPTAEFAFGDYAASERQAAHSSYRPWDYRAAITHSLPEGWLICRHANKNDATGWVASCKTIIGDARFRPLGSWCDEMISATANADVSASHEPRFWHATRMNGHMERQHQHAMRRIRRAA